jgi:hypothetical protein
MKHRGAERVLAETAEMTAEQELEYWRAATESLKADQRRARKQRSQQRPSEQPGS